MKDQEVQWFIGGEAQVESKKLPYVPTWATFSKLPDDEKAKLFNAMRGELIMLGRLENK